MDAARFDHLIRRLGDPTRRAVLGLGVGSGLAALLGLSDAAARKRKKKKKKCKKSQRKCGKTCIASTSCCTTADCADAACQTCQGGTCVAKAEGTACAVGTCQGGACTPNPCEGKDDLTPCGDWDVCDSPRQVCGDFCSGGVCAQIPTCNGSTDPCGAECCEPTGAACNSFPNPNWCGCSSVDYPCYTSDDCCGPGVCVGFICQLP